MRSGSKNIQYLWSTLTCDQFPDVRPCLIFGSKRHATPEFDILGQSPNRVPHLTASIGIGSLAAGPNRKPHKLPAGFPLRELEKGRRPPIDRARRRLYDQG